MFGSIRVYNEMQHTIVLFTPFCYYVVLLHDGKSSLMLSFHPLHFFFSLSSSSFSSQICLLIFMLFSFYLAALCNSLSIRQLVNHLAKQFTTHAGSYRKQATESFKQQAKVPILN